MNVKYLFLAVALAATTASAKADNQQKSGIDKTNMDLAVKPGTDFYEYACGSWMKNHPLPPQYPSFGSFEQLYETNRKQLQDIIVGQSMQQNAPGSLAQKIGDLYAIAMDSIQRNHQGYQPIVPYLDAVKAVQTRPQLLALMAKMYKQGFSNLFSMSVEADFKNSKDNLVQLGQGGMSLGQRDYYVDNDSSTVKIRTAFRDMVADLFALCGDSRSDANDNAATVMQIETEMAKPAYSATQMRVPESNYHKMTFDELQKQYPGIDWNSYFNTLGMFGFDEVNVAQPEALQEACTLMQQEPLEKLKVYMQWSVIKMGASNLSDELRARAFDFYGRTLSGQQQDQERWKKAVGSVEGFMGEGVGHLYVDKYFPEAAKQRMLTLVKNLQTALAERIKAQDWMSDATKAVALDKLAAFYVKIGYPNKWRDYSGLEIKDDSYFANVVRSNEFDFDYMVEKHLNKPVDHDEWFMTPQEINAYYNPTTNEICFPAGILQPPFFDMTADDAYNYGAIGAVIGHEMTHGFDDEGRQFDKEGNLRAWWQPADTAAFNKRTAVMVNFFSNINVLPDLKCNGQLTLGENLADHGGLQVAYQAFKNATKDHPLQSVDGFSPDQRFFLAYATVWAENISDAYVRMLTKSDGHSMPRWRVNGQLPHIDAWYEAFGITDKDPMFIPKDKRVTIW
jgi:putative endopeptidase